MEKWEHVHNVLDACGVIGYPLGEEEAESAKSRWLECFASEVKAKTGQWIYRGYVWHAYTYGFATALDGQEALREYTKINANKFLVWSRDDGFVFRCFGTASPDLGGGEYYVFPDDFAWTMIFTHEQGIGCGPYFARSG